MQLIQMSDAAKLSGVTVHQLKEWCARRDILPPDVPGSGRGRHALYSWQTVLAVRLLHELHQRFGVEVGAHDRRIRRRRVRKRPLRHQLAAPRALALHGHGDLRVDKDFL